MLYGRREDGGCDDKQHHRGFGAAVEGDGRVHVGRGEGAGLSPI